MAFNDALLTIAAQAMQAAATHMSLHTAAPDATGSNASAAARQPIPWEDPATAGDMVLLDDIAFTGGEASGPVTHYGFWSGAAGGTWYGAYPATGDTAFNAAGEYTVTGGQVLGSST